jgi:hypothetical protein
MSYAYTLNPRRASLWRLESVSRPANSEPVAQVQSRPPGAAAVNPASSATTTWASRWLPRYRQTCRLQRHPLGGRARFALVSEGEGGTRHGHPRSECDHRGTGRRPRYRPDRPAAYDLSAPGRITDPEPRRYQPRGKAHQAQASRRGDHLHPRGLTRVRDRRQRAANLQRGGGLDSPRRDGARRPWQRHRACNVRRRGGQAVHRARRLTRRFRTRARPATSSAGQGS